MTKKLFAIGSLTVFIGGSAVAGWRPPVVKPIVVETTQERLERAIRKDHRMIENAGQEGKLLAIHARREMGRKKLAQDQAALEAFKTAGPATFERAQLEKTVQSNRAEIEAARFESKLLSREARIKIAEKKLAQDEAALSALK